MPISTPSRFPSRTIALRNALLTTVDLLRKNRAADISDGYIDDYVALDWLEWNGGALRLTTTGENLCRQLRSTLKTAA